MFNRLVYHGVMILAGLAIASLTATGIASAKPLSADETRAIAKEAYLYGFPMVEAYKTLYAQAVDKGGANFKAPFNEIGNTASVYAEGHRDHHAEFGYALFVRLDGSPRRAYRAHAACSRGEPLHLGSADRSLHQNFAYLGKRTTGSEGGRFLIAGPAWHGEKPPGITKAVRCETDFAYALYRTQLFGPGDLDNVKRVQSGYRVQALSAFLGEPAPKPAPVVSWPKPEPATMTRTPAFFRYLNFLLGFAPAVQSETALMARFREIGVGPGLPFDETVLAPETRKALEEGIADGMKEFEAFKTAKIDTKKVSSADLFGTRAYLKNNYLYRYAGAKLGIFGNSGEEAIYPAYFVDASGQPLNAARNRYVLKFDKDKLPPANAFWSVTMYDGRTQLLADNPINRYLINSPMLPGLKLDPGAGLTLYVQHDSPSPALESNWLPAPDGPFYVVMRIYMPKPEVRSGAWKESPMQVAAAQAAPAMQAAPTAADDSPSSTSSETPIGTIPLSFGLPADQATRQKLYDELDFQRASQAYIWGLPIVSFAQWQHSARTDLGAGDTDMVIYESVKDKLGILTANATTPYIGGFPDLSRTGPLVIDYPAGATAGGIGDFWQRPVTDLGETGPDQGKGGKYLLLGPGQKAPDSSGYRVIQSPTNNVFIAFRVLDPDPAKARQLIASFNIRCTLMASGINRRRSGLSNRRGAPGARSRRAASPISNVSTISCNASRSLNATA